MNLEQTLLQKVAYYHGEKGIHDYTPFKEDAKRYSLEEIKIILEMFPNEKITIVPVESLNDVLTINEAAEIWKKDSTTLRRVIRNNKFIEGVDFRRSGKTILISRDSMIRVYGYVDKSN